MRKSFWQLCALFFALLVYPAYSQTVPKMTAKAWLLMDTVSNQVLASRQADMKMGSGTASKLMTTCLVFDALKDGKTGLDQEVEISEKALSPGTNGPSMFLQPGQTVTVQELLQGVLVHGADDAALALALEVSGDERKFVELMNHEATRIGMKSTRFVHPYGSSGKKGDSTPADLAILSRHIIRNYQAYYDYFSVREITHNRIRMRNPNRLLWLDAAVDGLMATNHAGEGHTLVASAKRQSVSGERRMLAIVTGLSSDQVCAQESLKLLNWGFQDFDMIRLFEKGQVVSSPVVWKGSSGEVDVGFEEDAYISVPKGKASRLRSVLVRQDPLIAPIDKGTRIGTLKIMADDKVIAELPVVALEQINVASFLGRLWDTICLWFK